jgi:hypothetical protein
MHCASARGRSDFQRSPDNCGFVSLNVKQYFQLRDFTQSCVILVSLALRPNKMYQCIFSLQTERQGFITVQHNKPISSLVLFNLQPTAPWYNKQSSFIKRRTSWRAVTISFSTRTMFQYSLVYRTAGRMQEHTFQRLLIPTVTWTAGDIDRHFKHYSNITQTARGGGGIRCKHAPFTFEVLTSQYILRV